MEPLDTLTAAEQIAALKDDALGYVNTVTLFRMRLDIHAETGYLPPNLTAEIASTEIRQAEAMAKVYEEDLIAQGFTEKVESSVEAKLFWLVNDILALRIERAKAENRISAASRAKQFVIEQDKPRFEQDITESTTRLAVLDAALAAYQKLHKSLTPRKSELADIAIDKLNVAAETLTPDQQEATTFGDILTAKELAALNDRIIATNFAAPREPSEA